MSSTLPSPGPSNPSRRNVAIAGGVVLFHVAALWALQTGLLRRAVEVVIPIALMSEIVTPPTPKVEPPPPAPPPPEPVKQPPKKAVLPPAPQPVARPDTPPSPRAVTATAEPQPPAPPIAAPVAPAPSPAPPAPPAPPKVELPSTSADYLQNPKPAYPPMSKRLGEQGKVVLRVLIGTDGTAQQAEIKRSSGFERLDQAGLDTVKKWRYVPGKRNGVPEAMWFDVPINFVLE
ncbi:MAG: energy transducer TonB [Pseudomonadota bacterium]